MRAWSENDALSAIASRLDNIERREKVRILFAVESGSRAWGFPSPDSDYDVRFVYLGPIERYLTLFPGRDVIEEPIELPFDVNGWDIKKALGLALASNPVLLEWLTSPMVYRELAGARAELTDLAYAGLRRRALLHHYLGLGWNNYATHLKPGRPVKLKKLFYVLRPVFALQWLLDRAERRLPPPMHLPSLVQEIELPGWLRALLEELLARKAATRELGEGPLDPRIEALADRIFGRTRACLAELSDDVPDPQARQAADTLFRRLALGTGR